MMEGGLQAGTVPKEPRLRCALLSSFTFDLVVPMVNEQLREDCIEVEWYVAPFNQYVQQVLDPNSALYRFRPQIVFLAIAAEDLFAGLPSPWEGGVSDILCRADERIAQLNSVVERLIDQLPGTAVCMLDLAATQPQAHSLLLRRSSVSLCALAARANRFLDERVAVHERLFVLDLVGLLATSNATAYDPRYFYLGGMRLGAGATRAVATLYRRVIAASLGPRKKCIVVDLDNTLWGGTLGEDGPNGLVLGDEGIGRAFRDLQRLLLEYQQTGTLLTICSRNDEHEALEVVQTHPAMVLRPHHFAAMRINWKHKAANIGAITDELNLGLDSVVFLDDSPYEREQVRRLLPDVAVPDLPPDPAHRPALIASLPYFDTLRITREDQTRSDLYQHEHKRRRLRAETESLEHFLASLEIEVSVSCNSSRWLARAAQLTQKTNQFNLTTRRYTETELCDLLSGSGWQLYTAEVRDRIGQSGVVGAALIRTHPERKSAHLNVFLLSCRVLGRGVESAFLAGILKSVRNQGGEELTAEFIATARNGVARDFLPQHGFLADGGIWQLALSNGTDFCPRWIRLNLEENR